MKQQVISKINQFINNIYQYIIKYNFHINNKNYIKFQHSITTAGLAATLLFSLLTLSILIPINLKGEKTIAASGDTSTTSLTLSTTSGSAELDLLVTSDTGTFASSTTPLTFSASTNNYTGYTLSIKSATSNTALTNNYVDGNNNSTSATFTSLSSTNATTKNGITATTFNSSTYNNQWGFKPSYYNSTANSDKFYPSPDSTGVTLNRTSCANNTSTSSDTLCKATSNKYTISIGARATYSQVAGTYTNTYILSAVGNYPQYSITYTDLSDSAANMPTPNPQSITSINNDSVSVALSIIEPSRTGYTFSGWCIYSNSNDYTKCPSSNNGSDNNGTKYNKGANYNLDLLNSNTIPLYAVWTPKTYNITIKTATGISSVSLNGISCTSTSGCTVSNLTYGVSYTLTATASTGYTFSNWSSSTLTYGSIASNTSASTTFTVGAGTDTLVPSATLSTFNLVVTGDSNLSSMTIRQGSTSGTTIGGTKSGNTITFSNLTYGVSYYLYPVFNSGYEFSSWTKTDTTTNAALGSTSAVNTYYKMGNGAGALTLASKASCTSHTTFSGYMQSLSSTTVANACIGDTGTLTDNRDSKTYTVAKLADGKLWMTQNLAFDAYANLSKITTSNTHVDSASLTSLKSGNRSAGNQYATAGLTSYWTSSYSYSIPMVSSTSGSCNDTTYCVNKPSSQQWRSTDTVTYTMGQSGTNTIGVYYNYCAATAGNYCYGSGTSQGTSSGSASYDICPYNWRLPTGGSSGEFQALYTAYSSNKADYVNALRLPLSGFFYNGVANYQASRGDFWSSTRYNSYGMYGLYVDASEVDLANYDLRNYGFSVRCVFSPV